MQKLQEDDMRASLPPHNRDRLSDTKADSFGHVQKKKGIGDQSHCQLNCIHNGQPRKHTLAIAFASLRCDAETSSELPD